MGTATMPPPKKGIPAAQAGEEAKSKKKRSTAPIQVDGELAEMLVVIAAHDQKNISAMVSPLIKQWVQTNYERVNREIAARIAARKAEEDRRD